MADAPRRTPAERLIRAVPWLALGLGILVFYWVEASLRTTPWVFTDELQWTQLSRAIAATGHAARRGQPTSFASLYSYLIAPAWWFHSTATAYAAIKYLNAVVMCLAVVPTYLLARLLVARRAAVAVALLSIAIPAMTYAASIVPSRSPISGSCSRPGSRFGRWPRRPGAPSCSRSGAQPWGR